MNNSLHFSTPFEDPVLVFSLVLLIILIAPFLSRTLRMPGIIGLIVAGIIVGPNGFNLLERDSSIVLFGTVGLLYIMFLAGTEIDLVEFKEHRNHSLVFGIITFILPMLLGTIAAYFILDFPLPSAILLASMFASHTLLAYPLLGKLGIIKSRAVPVTVGGTIITDTAALLVLAVIAGSTTGELTQTFWLKLIASLIVFMLFMFFVVPRIGRQFFRTVESEGVSQYLFVLAVVFISAFLAEIAGVEPIIGAFFAGLALNRLIPRQSILMNRIEFVGNALFIPFFLISTGMLVDIKTLITSPESWLVATVMVVVGIGSKWLAAYSTQKIFAYNTLERNIVFGLSTAQAAATLAAVLVGYDLNLLDENVLNGTILMILITSIVSSLVVENSGKKLAILEARKKPLSSNIPERILVPIANPKTIPGLMDLAIMMRSPASNEPIYPLAVVKDREDAGDKVLQKNQMLQKAVEHTTAMDIPVQLVSRIDLNIAGGIIRAIRELVITNVIIGWNAKITTREKIFGSVLDILLHNCGQMVMVCRLKHSINTMQQMIVVVPANAELELGFDSWMKSLISLSKQLSLRMVFHTTGQTIPHIKSVIEREGSTEVSYIAFQKFQEVRKIVRSSKISDLVVSISARPDTVSHSPELDTIPRLMARQARDNNFIIVYPAQAGFQALPGQDLEGLSTSLRLSKGTESVFSRIFGRLFFADENDRESD